ncbi:MAG: GGDEF domain-containing protein [Campylobacteraceae bacterium]|nr:GGDEF domain-containing protein [Campylobacteraceae bacterium]
MKNKTLKKKKSLRNIFILLVSTFLFSFLFIVYLSYTRHIEYTDILSNINTLSIPKIIDSSQVNKHVNFLVYSTEKLNNSRTQASRRLTYESILKEIKQIIHVGNKTNTTNSFLDNNLKVIQNELDSLNSLIEKILILRRKIEKKLQSLNRINTEILLLYETFYFHTIENKIAINNWRVHFAELVNLSYRAQNITKLNVLRQNISKQKTLFTLLIQDIRYVQNKPFNILKNYTKDLNTNNLVNDGLLELRLEQLRISGRAIGHGNFVNNLIYDFSRELEFQAIKYTESVILNTKNNQKKAKEQIDLMIIYFIVIFFILIAILYYINKIIIKRLVTLNQNVQQKISGEHITLSDKRNDEISHITYSINYFSKKVYVQKKQLERLSLSDALTGIPNRRAFDIKLINEISLIKRTNYSMSILMIDVDFFKLYNDYYGHQMGDDCLQKIGKSLKSIAKRDLDLVARYGGEEFVCILSNCSEKNAKRVAQNILEKIQALKILHQKSDCSKYISVSIGLNTVSKNDNLLSKVIIEKADKSLYKAKQLGRNQFVVYENE